MLSFKLLGQTLVYKDKHPLNQFRSQKELALLAYLAHTNTSHERKFIAELFWNESPQKQALSNLRTILSRLRKQLGNELAITRTSLALTPENQQNVDSVHLLTTLNQIKQVNSPETARTLDTALTAYQGKFLANFYLSDAPYFEEWKTITQEHIHKLVTTGYYKLGQYALSIIDTDYGIAVARRWLQVDALDEAAHFLLLWMLITSGRKRDAILHYDECVQLLATELGVKPSAEIRTLMQGIRPKPSIIKPSPMRPTNKQHNLPTQYDQFFGRTTIQQEIHNRLNQPWCRLITIVGPGGIGKTRLATTIAHNRLQHHTDGAWFVELTNIEPDDPNLTEAIAIEIANTINLRLNGPAKPVDQLLTHLQNKKMLLILDNFDHLIEGDFKILLDIIQRCETVQLIATSREPLKLRAEWVIKLPGLDCPVSDTDDKPSDAMNLFMARLSQRQWGKISTNELIAARRIVRILEGWPLAIELAASLTENITISEILEEISHGFDALTSSMRDLPPHHRSMQTIFEMSWNTLSPDLQKKLARLSIFQTGFTKAAARQVTNANTTHLAELCNKSLLSYNENTEFYRLHPVIQAFAAQKLLPNDPIQYKHAYYYLTWLAQYTEALQKDTPQQAVVAISPEIDNIRLAWRTGLTLQKTDLLLAALPALCAFYQFQGLAYEGEATMQTTWRAAISFKPKSSSLITQARLEQARFQNRLGQYRLSIQTLKRALKEARESKNLLAEGTAYIHWGESLWRLGQHDIAQNKLNHALDIANQLNNVQLVGWCHHHLGIINDIQGHYKIAHSHLRQACFAWKSINALGNLSNSLNSIGLVCYHQGNLLAAQEIFEQALTLCNQLDNRHLQSLILNNLSIIATEQGTYAQAEHYLQLGLELAIANSNLTNQGEIYVNLGRNYRLMGQNESAIESLELGLQIAQSIGNRPMMATALLQLAKARQEGHDVEGARVLYNQVLNIARQDSMESTECEALLGMAKLLRSQNVKEAKVYVDQAIARAKAIRASHLLKLAKDINRFLNDDWDQNIQSQF